MKKKVLLIVCLLVFPITTSCCAAPIKLVIEALNSDIYFSKWEDTKYLNFDYEGINISMKSTLTKYEFCFRETMGRDINIVYKVPGRYIKVSSIGVIRLDNYSDITWNTNEESNVISFILYAHQDISFNISKTSLTYGGLRKSVHNFWNYVEYAGSSKGKPTIIIDIDKKESSFEIDNKHIIVQYKSEFYGWYYPLDDASSSKIGYYYINEKENTYQIVVNFKNGSSTDVKLSAFPGASEGFFNIDSVTGAIARAVISIQVGIKKAIIDLFNGEKPKME